MKHFFVNKNVLFVCASLTAYYFVMELYYVYFIVINYSYYRFAIEINYYKYIETKILFVLILGLSLYVSRKSEFVYSVFVLFVIFFLVPSLITYSFSDRIPWPLYSTLALLIALGTISVMKIRVTAIQRIPLSYGVICFLLILTMIPILFKFGIYFNLNNLLLEDIDATRRLFEESTSPIINYLYNWLVKAIAPLLLVFFLIRKRYGYASISLLILLYLYIISGNKLVYITSFVVLFFFFVGTDYFEKTKYLLIALVTGLVLLPVVDIYILGDNSLRGIFVMRMLFLPSQLNYYYFDFFSDNPLYYAESNLFNLFIKYPYDKPIGYIMSETYFQTVNMNANNGIISDGFMNLGYLGIGLNISIVSVIFLFFNSLNLDSRYMGIFFIMIFLLLSVPMLSMFITSGLWIIFLMALTIMRKGEKSI